MIELKKKEYKTVIRHKKLTLYQLDTRNQEGVFCFEPLTINGTINKNCYLFKIAHSCNFNS
jgi:hypothetical protein